MFISSCASINAEHKSSINDVINSMECNKPCWLGIEEGMTFTIDDVENILQSYYGENNVVHDTGGLNPKHGFQSVIWKNDTKSDSFPLQHGGVTLNPDGQAHSIQVFIEEQWFTVGDMLSSLGEPELAVIINFNNYPDGSPCGVWRLLYPSLGLSVHVWQDDNPDKIEASDYISFISFSKPWLANDTAVNNFFDILVNWNGYGDYSQYCAKGITPSP